MSRYYLAVDIGASSGRHILGSIVDGKIQLEEIYRFDNGLVKKDGELCWDLKKLLEEIKSGLKKCKDLGKIPYSMGIDTWGVDYVLLDERGEVIGNTVGYRDDRTQGMDKLVYDVIPEKELYLRTGIQKQVFNTIYQLMAVKEKHPEYLEQAEDLLMIPDYFHYLLTGVKKSEYTNATTGQLVSPITKEWDYDLIEMLGYPKKIFRPLSMPGTTVGMLTTELEEEIGFGCQVVLPATHDTGSAVLSVPANDDDFLYISSGTWSLMGIERKEADCSLKSMEANFANEGGYDYRFRYLKNIMGLWMIQSVRHELNDAYSFAQLCELAECCGDFDSRVDVNDLSFLAPDHMIKAIQDMCVKTNQKVPETPGELARVIYHSLADSYAKTVSEMEAISGRNYSRIHIVGGGCNADYLNRITAKATGKEVHAGPTEATAIGNLAAQMLAAKEFDSVEDVREAIYQSFEIKKYSE